MHLTVWKSVALCTALLFNKGKKKRRSVEEGSNMASVLKEKREMKLRQALEEASEDGFLSKSQALIAEDEEESSVLPSQTKNEILHSRTLVRLKTQRDFLAATAQAAERLFDNEESIPGLDEAFAKFKKMYPKFDNTEEVDEIRSDEYGHLEETLKVCLDYCGFGLFSYLQQFQQWESSSFGLSALSANLSSHALNGVPEEGTAEHDIRSRIMDYLSIPQNEYSMVFTVSRGSAFNLLAEAYPFHQNRRLLTMYDYESQSLNWMAQTAREKGAKVQTAWFKWPTLRLCSTELRKQLQHKKRRKKDSAIGLFVFPVQSRVTGAKYSYQWMSLAQQNRWHVLLDAGALGPKDMDSLGLSLFRPDFIITSFYKVFGSDPTGFGCLFIKNSVIGCLENKGNAGAGMVRIVPVSPQYLSDCGENQNGTVQEVGGADEIEEEDVEYGSELQIGPHLPVFSGAFTAAQVRDVFENEMDYENSSDRDGASTVCEDIDDLSVEDIMKSPIFSEEDNEDMMCIDLGESPGAPKTLEIVGKCTLSNIGLRQLQNGISQRAKHRQASAEAISKSSMASTENGPVYDEEKQSTGASNEVVSFDAAVSSVSQDTSQTKSVSDAATSSLKRKTAQSTDSNGFSQDEIKKGTISKSRRPDTQESVCTEQNKSQADPDQSKANGDSLSHGSGQGHNILSKDEMGLSRRIDSQRFPKQTKISFNLDNQAYDSAGCKRNDNTDKRGNTSELGSYIAGEVESTSDEIISGSKVEKYISGHPIHVKHGTDDASTSLINHPRESGKVCFTVGNKQNTVENGCETKENSIRRETEGAFRLLGRREEDRFLGGRFAPVEEDRFSSSRRIPYSLEEHRDYFEQGGEESEATYSQDDGLALAAEAGEDDQWMRKEPLIFCRHLDHVDALGLNKTTLRLRYLINWLVTSLLQLRHPGPDGGIPVVHIYGPKIRYDRGSAVAFNLYDHSGTLLNPESVQKLAEKNRISLGLGFLSHLRLMENYAELKEALDASNTSFCKPMANGRYEGKNVSIRVEVVTASLAFLTNFEDVYRLWAFAAKFLNASFAKGDESLSVSQSGENQ